MRKLLFLALPLALCAGAEANAGCPDMTVWGGEYQLHANDLREPKVIEVAAGGNVNLAACRLRAQNWRGPLAGYTTEGPDISLVIQGVRGRRIAFSTQSDCDSVMLLNTAAQNWYFDDDDNASSGLDAQITLTGPAGDGVYDVWVGSMDGTTCATPS